MNRRKIVLGGVLALLLIQLVPYGWDHTNPPVVAEPQWDTPKTRELFMRACGDCHSNETKWPWYSRIAPVSWLVAYDVAEGREHFNVSMWGIQKKNDGDEAAEELREGEMPPLPYLLLHPEARLDETERAALVEGLVKTFGEEKEEED
ncbi:heme-binding domain-containing protein [Hydrogenimonas sp.]